MLLVATTLEEAPRLTPEALVVTVSGREASACLADPLTVGGKESVGAGLYNEQRHIYNDRCQ